MPDKQYDIFVNVWTGSKGVCYGTVYYLQETEIQFAFQSLNYIHIGKQF